MSDTKTFDDMDTPPAMKPSPRSDAHASDRLPETATALSPPFAIPAEPKPESPFQTAAPAVVVKPAPAPVPAADRPRRSRAARSQIVVFLNLLMTGLILAVLAGAVFVYIGRTSFESPGPSTVAQTFLIKPNSGTSDIAAQLERAKLITSAQVFRLGLQAFGNDGALKAGEYEIAAGASMHQIMDVLKSGKSITHSITIPEGLTVVQAFQRIRDQDALSGDLPSALPAEGSLAADTLVYTRGTLRKDVVTRMEAQQQKLVSQIWSQRAPNLPIVDVNQFVTLASIVEKETGVADERPKVAAVFVNRLRKKMRLQSDPTIIYGLFGGAGKPADRPIYQSDVQKPTPYNTYVIKGLPPGPIANPGRAALEAVANPADTDDLYFVADGTGGHAFASTLDEHNKNVARWRALQKQQQDDAAKTDADGQAPAGEAPAGQADDVAQ